MASPDRDSLIVDKLRCVACRHAAHIGGVREDREDFVQEFVVRMWMRASPGDRGCGDAWVHTCARNLASDFRRRILFRRRVQVPFIEAEPRVGGFCRCAPETGLRPEDAVLRLEMRAALEAGLATLTPLQLEAVSLRHMEGWRVREIADTMGLSPAAVSKLVERGVARLRRWLRRLERLWLVGPPSR